MRDKIVHHYFKIDLDVVWQTITTDVLAMKIQIESILERSSKYLKAADHFQLFSFLNRFTTMSRRIFGRWSMKSLPSQWSVSWRNARAA